MANQKKKKKLQQYISCGCTFIYALPLIFSVCVCVCVCAGARMHVATLSAIDWTVVSQAISLGNSSTRHHVSQHYSRGCCDAPCNSFRPRLSTRMMDRFPTNSHTFRHAHRCTVSFTLFSSLSLPFSLTHAHTHTHTSWG